MSDLQRVSEILLDLLPQAAETKRRAPRRKRASSIPRGVLVVLDTAVECRRDTEEISAEFDVRRPDVQDAFAHNTRRLVRKLQGEVRDLRREFEEYRRAA